MGKGSPIYYDMEGYNRTTAAATPRVLTFLDAWTRQLEAVGYVPGVYSSADAAIKDLQTTTTIAGHRLAEPKAIWIALWDNAADLDGTPYVSAAVWPSGRRSKQYQGNKVVKVAESRSRSTPTWWPARWCAGDRRVTQPYRLNSIRDHQRGLLS